MAYTTGAAAAAVITAVQTANPAIATDAVNNALSGLAAAYTTPIGTPVLLGGVLVKCTTGYAGGTPVYAYDATPV